MPYVEIKNSQQMMSFLAELKRLEQTPKASRPFQTVVIDTLDGYQRKLKEEWLQENKAQIFTGRDAWGFLDSKMQQLLVKLLNLDGCYRASLPAAVADECPYHFLNLMLRNAVEDLSLIFAKP